jgi:hypothetical protein
MTEGRLLYLDEDVPKCIAKEIGGRGRNALSIYSDGRKGMLDPELIEMLIARYGTAVVLITANETMPVEHGSVLRRTGLTLALIDGAHAGAHQDAWKRDVVHRWLHVIEVQESGTWRRYSVKRQGPWTRRRRQPQLRLPLPGA